jgi:DNA invertase Pin-like site-specific DNA recombinase
MAGTEERAFEDRGLDAQRKAISDYCRTNRITLVDIPSDDGVSGSNGLDSRDGLAVALARIERNEADVLVVSRFDRLAPDLQVQLTVVERLETAGARVISTTEPIDTGPGELRELIRDILASSAAYDRSVVRGRLLTGRRAKVAEGGYLGGIFRFGYSAKDGPLVPDASEQEVVARVRYLAAQGLSLRAIARSLNEDGLRPKRGDRWRPVQVKRVLLERSP